MTTEVRDSQPAQDLRDLGFDTRQRGFDLEISLDGVENSIEILATVEGIAVYVVSEDTDTSGTPIIPWIVFANLQRAIEQAILEKGDQIRLRFEVMESIKEDKDD